MGEPMHHDFRREVMETLGCHVYSFYGTTETGGIASDCEFAAGGHFDPAMVCPTVRNPTRLDDTTIEGEVLFTTLYIKYQSVVKYEVGDIVRLTTQPCPCGDPLPRLRFIERTHDSFILTGIKFRYQTILDAFREIVPELTQMSIRLSDISEEQGHTRLDIALPNEFAAHERPLLDILKHGIFEMDDVHQFGFVRFNLTFVKPGDFDERKVRGIVDRRKYMNV
jgi:phenylacetate-coenzyme A ligase PaaK-like adenylate-forming protein